jgi:hypothetical protein
MAKPINILLLDDKKEYCEGFKTRAQQQRILVDAVDNLENLLELLEENRKKYQFVVLDARAFAKEGQQEGSEHESHLFKAFREIKRIEQKYNRHISYCVNTGFADLKLNYSEEIIGCKVFGKGNEDDLLQFIWQSFNNKDSARLRANYSDVFNFADTYFDEANWEVLFSLLHKEKYESRNISDIISSLSSLRRLTEHTLDIIFRHYLRQISGVIRSRSTRSSDIINYLNDRGVVPPQVFGGVVNILKTASNFGSHTPAEAVNIEDYPTNNSIKALTYGYFEVVNWANKLLD